jgi:hypothetical protein
MPIGIGDLVLVIQMQDAAINSTNTGAYGDGVARDPATGWTAISSAGLYEYAVATSAVPLVGGGFPTLRVFGPASGRFLNLITCAGRYDPARRTYNQRLVVFAELL